MFQRPDVRPQLLVLGEGGTVPAGRQFSIVAPPIEPDLLGLVERTDEQPDPDREQLDFGERNLDVTRDHQALVQHPVEDVDKVVFGYTVANDVTARDLQRTDGQWARAKGFDTFCPLGPWIETNLDPADLRVTTELGGEVKQDGRTSDMVFSVADVVAYVSSFMTLLPGDVVLTGTPEGVGPMQVGDSVSVTVEGIGTLTNPVVSHD